MADCILALDQGTTSSRAVVFDSQFRVLATVQHQLPQIFPSPGWVEHDPNTIWRTQLQSAREALQVAGLTWRNILAIGIANQRETTVVWDRRTGQPLHNAIVWQCRRTDDICRRLREQPGVEETFRERTGLVIDPYFSGTKIRWLLDHVDGLQVHAEQGRACFGTVDSWLLWCLTGGRAYATDTTNASRTLLFNIHRLAWDNELIQELNVPLVALPDVQPSISFFGHTTPELFGGEIPILGVAGDQQAALFGQLCLRPGMAKNTYGTGCFLLMNIGTQPALSKNGLLTTIACSGAEQVQYALEGSVFIAGAVVQWLRDQLGLIRDSNETAALAGSVPDTAGLYLVPAFVGLGSPYWDQDARGLLIGLTRGSSRAHVVRAALEAIAYQSADLINAMGADSGVALESLRVDGGASRNEFLMQFQADILGIPVERPADVEVTARGAALLAAAGSGQWENPEKLQDAWQPERTFMPSIGTERRENLLSGWHRAVERSRGWHRSD